MKPTYNLLTQLLLILSLWLGASLHVQAQAAPSNPKSPAKAKSEGTSGNGTEIHVKNADISAVIKIFGKKAKRNFILDERVKGTVSMYLPSKVSGKEAIKILDAVLALKGFTAVPIGENLWKVIPSKEAKSSTLPTYINEEQKNPTATLVTRLVNLKYVDTEDIRQIVAPLISPDGLVNAYTGTNSLILIDSADNIQRVLKIVEALDVPFSDTDMTIFPIVHAEALDVAEKLEQILGENGDSSSGGGAQAESENPISLLRARLRERAATLGNNGEVVQGQPASNTGAGGAGSIVKARSRSPKIIPDERTNSIIVVADDDTTAKIRALIDQLDSKVDRSGNRFYVYHCQHASAEELADVLSGLAGGGGSSGSSRSSGLNSEASGGGLFQNSSSGSSSRSSTGSSSRSRSRTLGQSRRTDNGSNRVGSVNLGEEISITADPSTNSLVISASRTDYNKILELLKELDIKRRQVLVEAVLLEVAVDNTVSLGMDFMTSLGGDRGGVIGQSDFSGNLQKLLADPTQLGQFAIAAASSGTLTLPGSDGTTVTIPTQSVLVTAARTNSNANVLSAPTILTTDNEEAEIVVGENLPFLSSVSTSETNLNNTFNQIERQDVGITLRITPQISSGGSVTLRIFTEVSAVQDSAPNPELGPRTTVRTSETTVISKDGQMIVIGGLISDNVNNAESGVPFLKDIPVIGSIFRNQRDTLTRRNLLVFITPRIVQDPVDAHEVTVASRNKLEDVIAYNDVYPDRKDVLRRGDIDRVSEANMIESKDKPSTILPPEKIQDHDSPDLHVTSEEPLSSDLEITVAPPLPGKSKSSESSIHTTQEGPMAAIAVDKAPALPSAEGTYLLFKADASSEQNLEGVPFSVDSNSKLVGIRLPSETSKDANAFFQIGAKYAFKHSAGELPLTLIGKTSNQNEILNQDPHFIGSFYTLSPYELMGLGDGPWLRK